MNDEHSTVLILDRNENELLVLKKEVRQKQKEQRELLKENKGVLTRNYNHEAYNRMISNIGAKEAQETLNVSSNNGIMKVEDVSDPLYYEENCKLREEYHEIISKIKENLPVGPLEKQAKFAYKERDRARITIRNKMNDKKAVEYLQLNKKPLSFDELIEKKKVKLKLKGIDYTMDDIYKDIIETASKSNEQFDKLFKRSDKK